MKTALEEKSKKLTDLKKRTKAKVSEQIDWKNSKCFEPSVCKWELNWVLYVSLRRQCGYRVIKKENICILSKILKDKKKERNKKKSCFSFSLVTHEWMKK